VNSRKKLVGDKNSQTLNKRIVMILHMSEKTIDVKELQNLSDFNCVFCFAGDCNKCFSFERPHTKIPSPAVQDELKNKTDWKTYLDQYSF
jgi:hypothetical protein